MNALALLILLGLPVLVIAGPFMLADFFFYGSSIPMRSGGGRDK